jgi:hypothetical protein
MKAFLWILLVGLLLPGASAAAGALDLLPANVKVADVHAPARWAPRHDVRDARLAITNREGDVTLLLTDEVVAIQFSEHTLREIHRRMREDEDTQDNAIARALASAVMSGVRTLLDHSAECPIRALHDAAFVDGRLVFTAADGRHVLEGMRVDDREALAGFAEGDARTFARECERIRRQKH